MTYVREQTSAELEAHMRRLQAMPGWHDPLADRLWQEVQQQAARITELEAQIATVAPAVDAQPVGVAGTMPGTDGFTMAAFKASEVPVGTPLYTSAQSEGLRKALKEIAEQEHIELMLDPTWAQRVAIAALSQHKAGDQS
ncbi:TPA: hypothetical protein ACKE3D_002123 [Burkholderia dolosa]